MEIQPFAFKNVTHENIFNLFQSCLFKTFHFNCHLNFLYSYLCEPKSKKFNNSVFSGISVNNCILRTNTLHI